MSEVVQERAVYVDGPNGPLFGVVTTTEEPINNVVLCSGGWHGGSLRANRMIMRLAHTVATRGADVVRFDWHGSGESPEHIRFFNLAEPFGEDTVAAARLHADATLPTSLVGFCFGARSALDAAPSIESLDAMVLVSFPLPAGRTKVKRAAKVSATAALREGVRLSALKGWFQPATRRVYLKFLKLRWRQLKKRFVPATLESVDEGTARRQEAQAIALDDLVGQLGDLIRRDVRVLMVFGKDDVMYEHWLEAQQGELGELLKRDDARVDVTVVDGDLYGFSSLESQETIITTIDDWLSAGFPTGP